MKYKTEELEQMTKGDLVQVYRKANTSLKKEILKSLANSRKFAALMGSMYPKELEQMIKIHPNKEAIVDTMIDEMELHGTQMSRNFDGNYVQRKNFNMFMDSLQYKGFFTRVKENLTGKPVLPESLSKKIEQAKSLYEIEVRRTNATGKKMEKLEKFA